MNERIVYHRYRNEEKDGAWSYYSEREVFAWRFYIRIIQDGEGWFTPCNKCQAKLTEVWTKQEPIYRMPNDVKIVAFMMHVLCEKCETAIRKKVKEYPIIIGNPKYEPWVELSRAWIAVDDSIQDATKEEYETYIKHKG